MRVGDGEIVLNIIMKVAYQGEPGAYSEQAVNELLGIGDNFVAVGYDSFDAAFAATSTDFASACI